jgi:hypothetical protein
LCFCRVRLALSKSHNCLFWKIISGKKEVIVLTVETFRTARPFQLAFEARAQPSPHFLTAKNPILQNIYRDLPRSAGPLLVITRFGKDFTRIMSTHPHIKGAMAGRFQVICQPVLEGDFADT